MIGVLRHRGPDGDGFHVEPNIGLAHTRLSIIDLAAGEQPIANEDQTVWVVFNGEIFNFIELRRDLERQGHVFSTHTDTEVIVHLYEEHGEDFVQYLNGQFAIALWDRRQKKLLLVRDRVGIHPLFYAHRGSRILFASEVKAILPVLGEVPSLNPQALDQIMTFWSPVGESTVFAGISQLQPGEMLVADSRGVNKRQYWLWAFPAGEPYPGSPVESQAEELHDLLYDATRLRLRADVPVGAYLSGGLDSSVLTTLMHEGGARLRTFSIGFADEGLDESSYQQAMISHLGTDHDRIHCNAEQIGESFERAIWHAETPILRTAPVPMMLLSQLVHDQNYKVVLTGEGADEVFGGYDLFKEAKIRRFWATRTDSAWRPLLLKRLYPYLDVSPGRAQSYLQNFFGAGLAEPELPYFSHIPRWTTTAKCKEFFSEEMKERLRTDVVADFSATLPKAFPDWHSFNQAQYIEAKTLMSGYLLCSQGDRMLMANSVEGRFPYLDHRVIEFANRLDPRLKMKVLNEKYLLKRAMQSRLPATIVQRFKQPYRAPDIPAFLSGAGAELADDLMSEDTVQRYGYFDPRKVSMLLRKARAGRAIGYKDNMAFVGILSTQVWHRLFVEAKGTL